MKTKAKKRIQPVADRLLVRRNEADEKTSGSIRLRETAKEKPKQGEVLAAGDGKLLETTKRRKPSVEQGDRIPFSFYGGTEVKVDGEDLVIKRDEDILAVLA